MGRMLPHVVWILKLKLVRVHIKVMLCQGVSEYLRSHKVMMLLM